MKTTLKRNWLPVIGSLLKTLQDDGFILDYVNVTGDGIEHLKGTPRQRRQQAKKLINSVDESSLYVRHPLRSRELWLFVVLGNEPEETVANYTFFEPLDTALEKFSKRWEDIPCPVK